MPETLLKQQTAKNRLQQTFEFALLTVCMFVIALRAMYAESPNTTSIFQQSLSNQSISLIISSLLIVTFAAWLIFSFITGKFSYRFNWIEVGAVLFIIAGIIGFFAASSKRIAITDCVTVVAPMLMAVLLVQLLDSDVKIRLVLMVIVACGVTSTYKCFDQNSSSNQIMIDQYEEDPAQQLSSLNIRPNSFQHFLYEHRLYSRDVPGFFTTGNSAGSFLLIAIFAAIALFWGKLKDNPVSSLIVAALTSALLFGLYLTHSKGATAAIILSFLLLACYLALGKYLKRFKIPIIVICVLAVVLAALAIMRYELPGGNSMLVRFQYWVGAMKIYALKPFTGVGGGNFATYYTLFKEPGALESVKDPHNFLLSILTSYGPLGLTGILCAFLIPMFRTVFRNNSYINLPDQQAINHKKYIASGIIIALGLLIARPKLLSENMGSNTAEFIYLAVYLYIMPLIVFTIAWLLMSVREIKYSSDTALSSKTSAIIFCGIAGAACHNIIDFAFFEPGVSMVFWTLVACMTAWNLNNRKHQKPPIDLNKPMRIAGLCISIILLSAYFKFAVSPPVYASILQARALRNYAFAHEKLDRASAADPIDAKNEYFHGRFYLKQFDETGKKYLYILDNAIDCFQQAAKLNKANFKNYEKIGQTYNLLADNLKGNPAAEARQKALHAFENAIERYPNSDRLNFSAAQTADKLNDKDTALKYYSRAIEIENAYRKMFEMMYPERELFSRLGQDNYQQALKRKEQLSK